MQQTETADGYRRTEQRLAELDKSENFIQKPQPYENYRALN